MKRVEWETKELVRLMKEGLKKRSSQDRERDGNVEEEKDLGQTACLLTRYVREGLVGTVAEENQVVAGRDAVDDKARLKKTKQGVTLILVRCF